jgi:hypothetical protein
MAARIAIQGSNGFDLFPQAFPKLSAHLENLFRHYAREPMEKDLRTILTDEGVDLPKPTAPTTISTARSDIMDQQVSPPS